MKISVGSIVLSKAGRDKGRYFVVTEVVDENYVRISDGDLRKAEKAKLKKVKHLKFSGDNLPEFANMQNKDKGVVNAELRSALKAYKNTNSVQGRRHRSGRPRCRGYAQRNFQGSAGKRSYRYCLLVRKTQDELYPYSRRR